jgi:hypothetical protein
LVGRERRVEQDGGKIGVSGILDELTRSLDTLPDRPVASPAG